MRLLVKFLPVLMLFICSCGQSDNIDPALKTDYPLSISLTVVNKCEFERKEAVFTIPADSIISRSDDFNMKAFVVLYNGVELPGQAIDFDSDGKYDEIMVRSDFQPGEKKTFTLIYAEKGQKSRDYNKMTQAELSIKVGGKWENRKYIGGEFRNIDYIDVPPEQNGQSSFFRYNGPGWESDKVGYRFNLDSRNSIDIFGKKTSEMVLQNIGFEGSPDFHKMADWGMDMLHGGSSLVIGTLGMLGENEKVNRVEVTDSISCRIVENGPIYSQIRTTYNGWKIDGNKYDVVSDLSIAAGSRKTKHEIKIDGAPENLCTGIVKHVDVKVLSSNPDDQGWLYFGTFGRQSTEKDNLGLAILYNSSDLIKITEDAVSHVIVLKPGNGRLTYYYLFAWEQEPQGIKTEEAFKQYLEQTVAELNSPIEVE